MKAEVLGDEHPDTLTAIANLGITHHHLGRHQEASELLMKALEMRTRVLGAEHPDTRAIQERLDAMSPRSEQPADA